VDIPTIGLVLPLIRSLQQQCAMSLDAARAAHNVTAVAILSDAHDAYANYFEEWASNDLLLAATLLDPTQANAYFAPQGLAQADAVNARTLLERAWTAVVNIGVRLNSRAHPPAAAAVPPDADDDDAAAAVQAPAFAGLLGLLGGGGGVAAAGGGFGVAGAPAYSIADERPSFFSFLQEEFVKRDGDRVSACAWYRRNMARIPKIAAM
jgi:hypothetical protein